MSKQLRHQRIGKPPACPKNPVLASTRHLFRGGRARSVCAWAGALRCAAVHAYLKSTAAVRLQAFREDSGAEPEGSVVLSQVPCESRCSSEVWFGGASLRVFAPRRLGDYFLDGHHHNEVLELLSLLARGFRQPVCVSVPTSRRFRGTIASACESHEVVAGDSP